jgi:hypothetical protein
MSMVQTHRQLESAAVSHRLRAVRNKTSFKIGSRFAVALAAMVLSWSGAALAAEPHVVLLRGWFGVFSAGLDNVAEQLKTQGFDAKVAGHLTWSAEVAEILKERAAGKIAPVVLVGHSQGANNVIDMARSLESHHIPVDLMITLTPFMQGTIPNNVVRAVNYYNSSGWGQPIAGDPGFQGKIVNIDLANDPTITHVSIDKSVKVRIEIVQEITALAAANSATANVAPTITAGRPPTAR